MKESSRQGWDWLIAVGNHLGVVLALVFVVGAGYLSWTNHDWWLAAFLVTLIALVAFSVGAYKVHTDAQQALLKLVRQGTRENMDTLLIAVENARGILSQRRNQANNWLRELREEENDAKAEEHAGTVEFLADNFWLGSIREALQGFSETLATFEDESVDPLVLGGSKRERTFASVQRRVKQLDRAIAELDKMARSIERVRDSAGDQS